MHLDRAGAEPVLSGERLERLGLGGVAGGGVERALDRRDGGGLVLRLFVTATVALRLGAPAARRLQLGSRPAGSFPVGLLGARWTGTADASSPSERVSRSR